MKKDKVLFTDRADDGYVLRNAVIESTELTFEKGVLIAWLHLKYSGSGQGFGGHVLASMQRDSDVKANYAGKYIEQILKTLEVNSWEKLPGTPLRAYASRNKVKRIFHYLKDENAFDPELMFKQLKEES